jgi:hypothetical protein
VEQLISLPQRDPSFPVSLLNSGAGPAANSINPGLSLITHIYFEFRNNSQTALGANLEGPPIYFGIREK